MALARLLWIHVCVLAAGVTAIHAQTIPPIKPPDASKVSDVPQSIRDEFYSERHAARRKNTPRIVLVPGILGSKIQECRADDSQCQYIWGTIGAVRRSGVDLSLKSDRVYRTDVVDSLLFKDIYGGALDHIRAKAEFLVSDRADDALVTVLHYDWRRSNGENAKLLKERVCRIRANAESSPIVIIAHSMGGLVTKVWAARHAKESCADGKKPDVTQIVFVATPHLGSPKAIKAVAEGYNILFDELTGLKQYLGWGERHYVLDSINQAGFSFPSLYELLPIRTSEYCNQLKPALTKATVPVVGEDKKSVNLFDIDTWRRYDLLRRIGSPAVRQSYYEHALAPLLRQAELLLCEIADFDPAQVADVVYLFGREKADRTYGSFLLRLSGIGDPTTIQGDGTVPVYSAQNFLVSSTRQTTEVLADHTSIISSVTMLGLINDLYDRALRRADLDTGRTSTQYASLLVEETAGSGNLISVSLDPKAWEQADDKLAIEINTKALAAMGYKTTDVAQIAATNYLDASTRARLFAVAASSTTEPSQRLTWIGEIARSSYDAGKFQDAIRTSTYITATTEKALSSNDPKLVGLQKTAKEVEGWSYLKGGNLGKFNELAASYAAKYALTKDDFKDPATPLVTGNDFDWSAWMNSKSRGSTMVYAPPGRYPFEAYTGMKFEPYPRIKKDF